VNHHPLFDLTGKTAIVTGGGRGLGEYIARAYAEAGANVVVCSRKVENCREVSDSLKETYGVGSLAFECDVTKPDDVHRVVRSTLDAFGSIDILVNNSGTTWGAPAMELPLDKWEKVMAVNATGTFIFSQAVAREMVKQKRGKIINMASMAGLIGTHPSMMDAVAYSASKGAVLSFTRDLAVKLAPHNIQVNAIAPGFFPTKMTKAVLEQIEEVLLAFTPAGRLGSARDIQGVALFLASPASDYVIGQTIVVDGGQSCM